MLRVRTVAALSFVFTCAFFAEYLPTFKRLRIPYDLAGYHYPLADYAFQALEEGRFPQWDAAIYSGTSFVGNIQAALFYPPMWLAFAANAGRRALSYQALEDLIFAHVWVAFLLCFLWLRRKGLADLACVLGAGVYAYSGYLCQQLQHLGLVAAYAWMPLGLWGIDDAVEQRRWQPLWKVTAASALCFLGGYVPMWVVFCVCMLSYAARRWKALLGTGLALAASIPIVMVQLLPAWEAASLKVYELKYGWGVRDAEYVIASLLPNYFDYSLGADPNSVHQYLYLGAPAIAGLLWLVHSRRRRDLIGIGIMLAAALVFATNPGNLVWNVVKHSHLGAEVLRDWYFLAGVMLAIAGLAAFGLDAALRAKRTALPPWAAWSVTALLAAWMLRDLVLWSRGQQLTGWKSAIDAVVALTLCALALYILPGQGRAPRTVLAAALLLFAGTQYKVYGIGKHFNAGDSMARWDYSSGKFHVMDQQPYDEIRKHPEYRIAVDSPGPSVLDLRHYRLTSPQGFDPFLTREYARLMNAVAHFRTDRDVDLDPDNVETLRLFGVRYFITCEKGPLLARLSASPHFRLLQPAKYYHKVFELANARPPFGWEQDGSLILLSRTPEERIFQVSSATGGRFTLTEQFFPGWEATVDGAPVRIEPWRGPFQAIMVPPGEHRVRFHYSSPGFRIGAVISVLSLAGCLALRVTAPSRSRLRIESRATVPRP